MLTRIAVAALNRSPLLRRLIWRWWYQRLAKKFTQQSWTFMNYGFELEPGTTEQPLAAEFEADRLCIQLYEQVLSCTQIEGKAVAEVGFGRGGGASYLARTHQPNRYTGVDFSSSAVELCRRTHVGSANLEFVIGDAQDLPLDDASCDVVLNVESSHCYSDIDRFFAEVARVLRPGGYFAIADFRSPQEMTDVAQRLASLVGFRVLESVDITERVVAAMARDDARKRQQIEEIISPRLRPIFCEFAGLRCGRVFTSLQNHELVYHRFLLEKNRRTEPGCAPGKPGR